MKGYPRAIGAFLILLPTTWALSVIAGAKSHATLTAVLILLWLGCGLFFIDWEKP